MKGYLTWQLYWAHLCGRTMGFSSLMVFWWLLSMEQAALCNQSMSYSSSSTLQHTQEWVLATLSFSHNFYMIFVVSSRWALSLHSSAHKLWSYLHHIVCSRCQQGGTCGLGRDENGWVQGSVPLIQNFSIKNKNLFFQFKILNRTDQELALESVHFLYRSRSLCAWYFVFHRTIGIHPPACLNFFVFIKKHENPIFWVLIDCVEQASPRY